MGTYSEFCIDNYPVFTIYNKVDPTLMTLFRETDKMTFKRKLSERNLTVWGDTYIDNDEIETAIQYSCQTKFIIQRLTIIGFSLNNVKSEFYNALEYEKQEICSTLKGLKKGEKTNLFYQKEKKSLSILEKATFEQWLSSIKEIIGPERKPFKVINQTNSLTKLIHLNSTSEWYFYFPFYDVRSYIRAMMEIFPTDSNITLDITDLVNAGYYKPNDKICELSLSELTADYPKNEKIIILTEGSIDKEFISKSLDILYPYLYDYFSFLDFDLSKSAGGASFLVSTIKALIGSGIKNRIIAIFDNDTASSIAKKGLRNIKIPKNISIIDLPELTFANMYPTIGPNGYANSNINGLACSIELFFGIDIIKKDDSFYPVHWNGFDNQSNKYQGEIINKKELQTLFRKKCSKCKSNPEMVNKTDWTSMDLIFEKIFFELAK